MFHRIQFNPAYAVESIAPDRVFFVSEKGAGWLRDRLYQKLASLIDGDRDSDKIIDAILLELLADQESDPENTAFFQDALNTSIKTQYALFQMEKQGYIQLEDNPLPPDLAIFCHHLNIAPADVQQRLQSTKVAVKSFSSVPAEALINLLESLHIQVAETGDITVVLADNYLDPRLEEFNQKALQSQSTWMLVKPLGITPWLGPIFAPEKTGCWHCLAKRLQDNNPVESFIERHKDIPPINPPLATLNSTKQTALSMTATEVFKWIAQGENPRLTSTLVSYDAIALQTQDHILVKRPQCPTCGEMAKGLAKKPRPVVLGHRKKNFTEDGGHRFCSPEETLRKYQHHISPITGVVRGLSKIHTNALNHTYVAKHHFLTVFDDLENLQKNLGGRSSGKGKTDAQARASGFCEAIERYSGVFQGDEIREQSSYNKLGDRAIHPNDCMNFSEQQYQHRQQWNAECQGWFQKVPEPFDPDREIDWTPVWSLTHQTFKYLPTAYCYYGYDPGYQPDCWADSNGCAAGNTIEEAILQGFMELVERDAVALWWYNRLQKPQVDLDSFDDPYFPNLRQYYRSINRELTILDLTSDLNIPTFAAVTWRSDRAVEDIVIGYGTHFDPKIALSRALTEVNQILPNVLFAQADGSTQYPASPDPLAVEWWKTATMANQPYLIPDPNTTPKVWADYPVMATNDLLDDVKLCQQIVESKGMEMLVLDQTRPDVGLRVAKVIIPGMRHMWKRLDGGRLYDVPVQLGWLPAPLLEDQLNPVPMWM